jgi:alkylation response protein AidB-like acyl-CoA dehydrogenase
LPNDRYFSLERRIETLNKTMFEKRQLLQDTIDNEGRIPKDVLFALRSQGFYGIASKAEHGGEGLTVTETTRLLEELALIDLSLSETIAGPVTLGLSAIQRFGTAEQVCVSKGV